jgi:putative ABC transport system permease protein
MGGPPRLAQWLVRCALPDPEHREALADLDDEYRARVRPQAGRFRAAAWYWRQAIGTLPFACLLRWRRRNGIGATGFATDLRYAVRLLWRRPAFALAVILTLGLGIGTAAAVTTVVHSVLLRPLPYGDPERLVSLRETHRSWQSGGQASYPDYQDWTTAAAFEHVAGHTGGTVTLTGEGAAERVPVVEVTVNFFDALGIRPRIGRSFEPDDAVGDGPRVVLITDAFWRQRFGADPDVIGRSLRLNGLPIAIVGVLPPGFAFPPRGDAPLWAPLFPSPAQRERRFQHWLDVIALLRPDVTPQQAELELGALVDRAAEEDPRWHGTATVTIQPLRELMVGGIRPALLLLLGATALVLAMALASVTGLLLARASARRGEFGVRVALGATRARVYRQILTESLLVAAAGAAAGLLVARGMLAILLAGIPARQLASMPHLAQLTFDWRVAALAVALAGLAIGVLAVGPAHRAMNPSRGLAPGSRITARANGAFVVSALAVAVVLLTGAGLLARSFAHLIQTSPGFETEDLVTFRLTLPAQPYATSEQVAAAHRDLLDRFARLPGIERIATINQLPLTGRGNTGGFVVVGEREPVDRSALLRTISDGYLAVQGLPLEAGRPFAEERPGAPRVVLVNRALADAAFPGGDAVGRRIEFPAFLAGVHFEIIGMVGNEQFDSLDRGMSPVVYFPYGQSPERGVSVLARTSLPPASVLQAVRAEVQRVSPGLPIFAERTMETIVSESRPVFLRRYLMIVIAVFAAATLLMAAVGLYGLLAGRVAERVREIGIRQALGATRADVLRLVFGEGLRLAAIGGALGLGAALGLARFLEGLLFGVRPADPATFVAVPLLLLAVSLAACWIPARRALALDPATALRVQ